ncbi:MAG: DUF4332 domain-containing protein [Acidimicrobiia bacterium]
MPSIDAIVGIPHRSATKLRRAGVRTTDALLRRAAGADGRRDLAESTGIDDGQLLEWCHRAELLGIRGVGGEYAHLLTVVGVPTLDDLAACDPEDLLGRLTGENDRRRLVRRLPTDEMVASWVLTAGGSERRVER